MFVEVCLWACGPYAESQVAHQGCALTPGFHPDADKYAAEGRDSDSEEWGASQLIQHNKILTKTKMPNQKNMPNNMLELKELF